MPIHEILLRYRLTLSQRDRLEAIRKSGVSQSSSFYTYNGVMSADVIHIEWKSVTPSYYLLSPKTKAQLDFDDSGDPFIRKELSLEDIEKTPSPYKRGIDNANNEILFEKQLENYQKYGNQLGANAFASEGRKAFMFVETKFQEDLYEATLIGDDEVVDFRKKQFTTRRVDNPADVFAYSYCCLLYTSDAADE